METPGSSLQEELPVFAVLQEEVHASSPMVQLAQNPSPMAGVMVPTALEAGDDAGLVEDVNLASTHSGLISPANNS